MSTFDFPDLTVAERGASRALVLLETAAQNAREAEGLEGWAERAQRLRGAAALATTAAIELAHVSGWNAAADAASQAGLLDRDEG